MANNKIEPTVSKTNSHFESEMQIQPDCNQKTVHESLTHSQVKENASHQVLVIIESNDLKFYKTKSPIISFLELYTKGQVVMNNTFLPYLELHEIFRLSMTCASMKKVIDPASVKTRSTRRQNNQKKLSKASATSFHLKRIAAFQLLGISLDDKLDHSHIDSTFGVDVRHLTDFGKLRGEIYKEQITAILEQEPNIELYQPNPDELVRQKRYWQVHGSSLHQLKHLNNPLQAIIDKTKVSYTNGGIFRLRNIQYNNYYLNYEIMIDRIDNLEDYRKLRQFEETAKLQEHGNGNGNDQSVTLIQFEEVKHMLNGVGRMYQYRKQPSFYGAIYPQQPSLHGVYDGQIKNGKIHGFGILILLSLDIHEVGYFKNGLLYGKSIYLKGVKDVRSIYDVEKMGFGDYYTEFTPGHYSEMDLAENVSEAQMHEIRLRILKGQIQSSNYKRFLSMEDPQLYQEY